MQPPKAVVNLFKPILERDSEEEQKKPETIEEKQERLRKQFGLYHGKGLRKKKKKNKKNKKGMRNK